MDHTEREKEKKENSIFLYKCCSMLYTGTLCVCVCKWWHSDDAIAYKWANYNHIDYYINTRLFIYYYYYYYYYKSCCSLRQHLSTKHNVPINWINKYYKGVILLLFLLYTSQICVLMQTLWTDVSPWKEESQYRSERSNINRAIT